MATNKKQSTKPNAAAKKTVAVKKKTAKQITDTVKRKTVFSKRKVPSVLNLSFCHH
jgi:hypothetical protein